MSDVDENELKKYVVVETYTPTTYGCHRGREWSDFEILRRTNATISRETYETYEQAVEAARQVRKQSSWFDGHREQLGDDEEEQNLRTTQLSFGITTTTRCNF